MNGVCSIAAPVRENPSWGGGCTCMGMGAALKPPEPRAKGVQIKASLDLCAQNWREGPGEAAGRSE